MAKVKRVEDRAIFREAKEPVSFTEHKVPTGLDPETVHWKHLRGNQMLVPLVKAMLNPFGFIKRGKAILRGESTRNFSGSGGVPIRSVWYDTVYVTEKLDYLLAGLVTDKSNRLAAIATILSYAQKELENDSNGKGGNGNNG